jgi:hypothetical protein
MKIPPIYNDSDVVMVIGSFPETASMDIVADCLKPENQENVDVGDLLHRLTVSLIALVVDEVESNKVAKTQPFINLCKFMVQEYPEIILDDDTYYIRKAVLRVHNAILENKNAEVVKDAFMEFDVPETEKTFQIQVTAVHPEHLYIPENKTQIIFYEEE